MAVQHFDEIKTAPYRGLQIYQILISLAYNRQTITYGGLADILGFAGAGVFAGLLGHIMNWCDQNELPPLTILVVNSETGLPGQGLVTPEDLHAEREHVFNYDWFGIVPPSPEQLALAHQLGHN